MQQRSPLEIGWRLLFLTGVAAAVNPFIGRFMHRMDAMTLLAGGLVLAVAGILLLTGVEADTGFGDLAWRHAIFGIAVAIMLTAVTTAAIDAVPWQLAGMAAAASTAMRQYGAALGPAVLGVILTARLDGGATPASAILTALVVTAGLLAIAAIACLLASPRPAGASR